MKIALLLGLMIVLAIVVTQLKKTKGGNGKAQGQITKKPVLTNREQAMYFRLTEALSEHVVLGQVAFSAMLKTKAQNDRNRFDRKVADFVVLNKSFEVLAVIELDDASHKNREVQDIARQTLLTNAGYRVIRYSNVPDIGQVRKDFGVVSREPSTAATVTNLQPQT